MMMPVAIHPGNDTVTLLRIDKNSYQVVLVDRRAAIATEELDRYSTFALGWDGYRGLPFSSVVISAAKLLVSAAARLMARIPEAGRIIPGPAADGSVDVEMLFRNKRLIFTIYPSSDGVEVHTYREHHDICEQSEIMAPEALGKNLRWLVS